MIPWCFATPPLLRRRRNLPPVPTSPLPGISLAGFASQHAV